MIKGIWSITVYVSDLEKSKHFYEDTLGLNKKYEYSTYVGFDCGGIEIGLIPRDKLEISKDSATINFFVDNVDETYQKLKEKGVNFIEDPHDEAWGGREALFLDPDGNNLEIMQIYWKKYFKISSEGA